MLKKALLTTTFLLIAAATPAFAQDMFDGFSPKERHEKMKAMSPDERETFFKERKAKWEAMGEKEKLEFIEKQRAERIKAMDAEWANMSAEEKIKHVEEKMQGKHEKRGKHKGEFGKPHKMGPEGADAPPAKVEWAED